MVSQALRKRLIAEPAWGPIGKDVYERTYSRPKSNGSKETWLDTVERTVAGNIALVPKRYIMPGEEDQLVELFYNFWALPAGRHLWASGVPGRQFLFNCHHSGWTKQYEDHAGFTFDELMKGGGTGTNFSNRYILQLGKVARTVPIHIVCNPNHKDFSKFKDKTSQDFSHEFLGAIRLEDSREGWVYALNSLISYAWGYHNSKEPLVFDVSLIRPEGEPIKGFGGTASGPAPLVELLLFYASFLGERVGKRLNTMDLMHLEHAIAACVVAGNVRRSARMSMKSWSDPDVFDFIHSKNDGKSLWSTNISVEYDDEFIRQIKKGDHHANKVLDEVVRGMLLNGEPGLWNYTLSQKGEVDEVSCTNPCGEIPLLPFENCNLGHVNLGAYYKQPDKAMKAFRLMTRFLMRATFGDVTHPTQKDLVQRNRRIGVGFFGYQSFCAKQGIRYSESYLNFGIRKFLQSAYDTVRSEASSYAFQLRVPEPVKVTTVAPTGTIAKLSGETEGLQPVQFRYGKRRVGFSTVDPDQRKRLEEYKSQGYKVEKSVYSPNTELVQFLYKDKLVEEVEALGFPADEIVESAYEISLQDYLSVQAMIQELYADNAISITVNIPQTDSTNVEEKAEEFKQTLIHYLHRIKGVTVMPAVSRPQMPYEEATKEEYLEAFEMAEVSQGEMECQGACPIR